MNFLKKFSFIFTMMGLCSLPAWAQVTVNYPANGAVVASQFSLSAYDSTCSGQPVSAMGFSLDSSSNNTFVIQHLDLFRSDRPGGRAHVAR